MDLLPGLVAVPVDHGLILIAPTNNRQIRGSAQCLNHCPQQNKVGFACDTKETRSFLGQFETNVMEAVIKKGQVVDAFNVRDACLGCHTSRFSKRPYARRERPENDGAISRSGMRALVR